MTNILGPDGHPWRAEDLTRPRLRSLAGAARPAQAEDAATGLTPVRLARLLRDTEDGEPEEYFNLAERMEEHWAHYAAVLGVRKRQVSQLVLSVEPADDSAAAEADAALVRAWVRSPDLENGLFNVLDAVGKGLSVTEVVWETSERSWRPRALHWVDPRWIRFDWRTLRRPRLWDTASTQGLPLAGPRWMLHQVQAKSGVPARTGTARIAAWYWLFCNFGVKGWVAFAESYGQPIRLGKYPTSATTEERRQLLQALSTIGQQTVVAIPDSMAYELVTDAARGASADVHHRLTRYMEQSVSKLVLGQTMTTDDGASLSQAKVHNEVRADVERADAEALAATLTRSIAEPLVAFNHGPRQREGYPRIRLKREDPPPLDSVITALEKLTPLGLEVSSEHVRRRLALPPPTSKEDRFAAPDPPRQELARAASAASCPGCGASTAALGANEDATETDALDDLVTEILSGEGWELQMEPLLRPLLEAAAAASDPAALRANLAAAVSSMNDTTLRLLLERGGFSARLAGEVGADLRE